MREGGSYVAEKGKKPKRVEGTRDHPEGNRARDKDGAPIDAAPAAPAPAETAEPKAAAAPKKPGKQEADR